jgi:hypothetical protein
MDAGSTEPVYRAPRPPRWPYVLAAAFLITGLAVVLLWPVKLPYYAISPGPVEDVADLITVTDAQVYDSEGKFYLLTVGLREVNAFEWFEARFLDPKVDLLEREVVRPPGVSQEQVTRTNLEAMNESIDTAIFVALEHLGYDVTFIEGGGAAGSGEDPRLRRHPGGGSVRCDRRSAGVHRRRGGGDRPQPRHR